MVERAMVDIEKDFRGKRKLLYFLAWYYFNIDQQNCNFVAREMCQEDFILRQKTNFFSIKVRIVQILRIFPSLNEVKKKVE